MRTCSTRILLVALTLASCAPQPSSQQATGTTVSDMSVPLDPSKKKVLAILGDAWHRVAPLDRILVAGLRDQGWQAVVIMDYRVPWDDFAAFDLIIMSREGREYVDYYRTRDTHPQPEERGYWLTPEQEMKFVEYVENGGRLFLYHDGFGNYECGQGVSQVARSCFISHPAIIENTVSPTGIMPELAEGITPFVVADEEYKVNMDESQTSVFLESHSEQNGRSPQAWAHPFGEGRVAVLIPGHNIETQNHPMIQRAIQNIMGWLLE